MKIIHGAAITIGFLLAIPAVPAQASQGTQDQHWKASTGLSQGSPTANAQSTKLKVAQKAHLAQLQHKVLTDTSVKLLDLVMDRRRKKARRKRRARRVKKQRRLKRERRVRRHNRRVMRHNRRVVRRHRRVVRHNRRVRRHSCPGGYYWSSYQRRCIKSCPAGTYYSYVTGRCRRRGRYYKQCPQNFYWSHSRRACVAYRRCGPGRYFDYALGRCKRLRTNCAYGWRYSPYKRRCVRRCPTGWNWNGTNCAKPARTCPVGYRWSSYYSGCVRSRKCPAGYSWNGYRCRRWRSCAAGYYWSSLYKKCRPKVTNCPFGYRYRAGWGCVRRCGSGWYWNGTGCRKNARRCPAGKFYSHFRRRCVSNCGRGFYWSYRKRRCVKRRW